MQTSTATVSSAKDRHSGLRARLARISRSACRTAGKHGLRLAAAGAPRARSWRPWVPPQRMRPQPTPARC